MFAEGLRARDARMTLIASRRDCRGDSPSRMAAAVSGRHGGAVVRNRIKRLCREAFRTSRHRLPSGWDYVMLPRVGANLTLVGLIDSLATLTVKISAAYERTKDPGDDS